MTWLWCIVAVGTLIQVTIERETWTGSTSAR